MTLSSRHFVPHYTLYTIHHTLYTAAPPPYTAPKAPKIMSCLRVLLAILFPPLAVIDRGCGSVVIVFLLTLCGWVPGVIGALVILNKNEDY